MMIKTISVILSLMFLMVGTVNVSAESMNGAGKATYVSGEVFVIRGDERLPLAEGQSVFASDTVVTADSGRVTLQMRDASKVYVGRLSRVNLADYALKDDSLISGSLNVLWGKVRFFVAKLSNSSTFKVSTRTAVLGVRGTEFVVIVPMPEGLVDPLSPELPDNLPELITTVYGIEGLVEGFSSSGERILIGPGVKVEFTSDGKIKFTSVDKPVSLPTVPGTTPPPQVPDVPGPEDIIVPPPQIRNISPGQFLDVPPV